MRKLLIFSFSLLVTLALLLGTGVTAFAAEQPIFLAATYMSGKGLVFTFALPGHYDASAADVSVSVNGVSYDTACHVNAADNLACVAKVPKSNFGSLITGSIDGAAFSSTFQDAREHCYSVYDYGPALTIPWGRISTFCQLRSAYVGQIIDFYNPNYGAYYEYRYDIDNSNATCGFGGSGNLGSGFYYDC